MLAKSKTPAQLEKEYHEVAYQLSKATQSHLRAIQSTASMSGCSQRRAQSKNNVTGLAERKNALKDALELHQYYPDKCAKGD
jgi:hypothetical protein